MSLVCVLGGAATSSFPAAVQVSKSIDNHPVLFESDLAKLV